jgi:hypothetical protein
MHSKLELGSEQVPSLKPIEWRELERGRPAEGKAGAARAGLPS